jgi:formamidase
MNFLWNGTKGKAPLVAKNLAKPPFQKQLFYVDCLVIHLKECQKRHAEPFLHENMVVIMDIKDISRGSRIFFPVYQKGAGLSLGDLHFSQGDGEIAFCGAIEMDGATQIGVDLIKGGMKKYDIHAPVFIPSKIKPHYEDYISFQGISVENGVNYYMDATIAYRQACLKAIDYLTHFGFSREQAYILLTSAPIEGRIGGIVDIPNCVCTVSIPTGIFERNILPVK